MISNRNNTFVHGSDLKNFSSCVLNDYSDTGVCFALIEKCFELLMTCSDALTGVEE